MADNTEANIGDKGKALKILLMAEDKDNPGKFWPVKGFFNSEGNFSLITSGSGSTGTGSSNSEYLLEDGTSFYFLEDGASTILKEG